MIDLRIVTYEEARNEFFTEKHKEALRKMEYWQRRAATKSVLSQENYLANAYGEEASFYEDVLKLLDKEVNK